MPINIFTPNMPLTPQSLGFTQPLVNANFGNYQENMELNHLGINTANFGKHRLIQFPTVLASSPGTAAGEVALYTKNVAGVPEVFFQPQGRAAAGADIQLTADFDPSSPTITFTPANSGADPVTGFAFRTFLPGNLMMVSGVATGASGTNGSQQIAFNFNWSTVWSVSITRFTLAGGGRSTHIITAITTIPASITVNSLDANGSTSSGFSYYFNVVASVP